MRISDSLERSEGSPLARLMVALLGAGLAFLVVGACAGRQQQARGDAPGTADVQEAAPRAKCADGGTPADGDMDYTVTPEGITRTPDTCVKQKKQVSFMAACGGKRVVVTVDGGTLGSPFKDGCLSFELPGDGGIVEKKLKDYATDHYELSVPREDCPGKAGQDGPKPWDRIIGTLEVVTSTDGEDEE